MAPSSETASEKNLEETNVNIVASESPGDDFDYNYTPEQVDAYQLDPAVARQVTRAMDLRIMPLCFCMYLFSALDRGNISNAKTDGLNKDLHLIGNQYNMILTAISVTFATCAVAGGYITRRFGPKRVLPLYMMGWGTMAMINAAVKNFGGAVAVRFFLGMFEGFFGPSVTIYLTSFYTRGELAKRMAIYYSSSAFSGAFSGLLAYGIFQANTRLHGWQILFLIEGGLTLFVAFIAMFFLPGYPRYCKFLTHEQKEAATMRLLKDASKRVNAPFNGKEFLMPLRQKKLYVFAAYALCYGTASSTATTFLAQIIGRWKFSTVKTNLYTVGPNLVGMAWLLANCYASDYLRQRSWFLVGAAATTMVGSIILVALPITSLGPGYFACYLISMGAFIPTCLFHSWHNNNDPSEMGRAFRTFSSGFLTFCANAGSLISSNIFLDSDAPKYTHALIASACLQVLAIIILLAVRTYMVLDNRKRNKEQGVNWTTVDVPTADLVEGPANPKFRHFL
ncbi:major facilitator superfamily domain-containing protein [Naematelia encephala]|uniref:Major facilitator superfamily domain-containing protein n=1 Tax=Naematelia encephala TaxID=71784 RepID=A0A1Y2BKK7_9TREE|nr:major facilitator superfamily domain-containing protein [Naematelia encephala]